MSIKCSLLGHSFGETTVEREREEEGTEVVITITEMETCSRCGESRVVSENKEVTTLEAPDDVEDVDEAADDVGTNSEGATDEFAATPSDDGTETDEGAGVSGGSDATDAVILDDTGDESSAQAEARGAESAIPDAESDAPVDADGEDAVIIGDAEDGRDPGEWPDEDDETDTETSSSDEQDDDAESDTESDDDRDPGEWPDDPADPAERAGESDEVEILDDGPSADDGDADAAAADASQSTDSDAGSEPDETGTGAGADAGTDVTADTDSASASAAGSDGESADGRSAGAWPEEEESSAGDDAMGEWPEATLKDEPADTGFSGPSLGEEAHSVTVPEGMFKCSECGFTTDADASSLRAGDFCPECHRGTLLEHEDESAAEE